MKLYNPRWIDKNLMACKHLQEVPEEQIVRIKNRLKEAVSAKPVVSVVIPAYNEELNLIRCLDSLSKNESKFPFEIIVVNNNSRDRTAEVLEKLGAQHYLQKVQGPGPARQLGLEKAKGKYILSADADCLYPNKYIQTMAEALEEDGVSVVYGNYSFLSESGLRINFAIYESLRNIMIRVRHVKRPYLNTLGISMGFRREQALREGYTQHNTRGEDGRLTFDLMKYGRVKFIKSGRAQVWTGARTLQSDGSLLKAAFRRVMLELSSFDKYFKRKEQHNTKETLTDEEEYTLAASMRRIKRKLLGDRHQSKNDN